MKINTVLQKKYPVNSDMYSKIESTKVCMMYNELVHTTFPDLNFSEAVSLKQGSLAVTVGSHFEAHQVKIYEFTIIRALNQLIQTLDFQVERLHIRMR